MARMGKVRALIFSRRNVGEADRLLTLFTDRYGLLHVMAKGVRKLSSRRGSHLEPLTNVLTVITGQRGRYFLSAVETLEYYPRLQADVAAQQQAQMLATMVMSLWGEEEPSTEIYEGLRRLWQFLPDLPIEQRYVLESAFILSLTRRAGVIPRLDSCLSCRRPEAEEAIVLDGGAGGWRCLSCHYGFSGTRHSLPAEALGWLHCLRHSPQKALDIPLSVVQARHLVEALRGYVMGVSGQAVNPMAWSSSSVAYG